MYFDTHTALRVLASWWSALLEALNFNVGRDLTEEWRDICEPGPPDKFFERMVHPVLLTSQHWKELETYQPKTLVGLLVQWIAFLLLLCCEGLLWTSIVMFRIMLGALLKIAAFMLALACILLYFTIFGIRLGERPEEDKQTVL